MSSRTLRASTAQQRAAAVAVQQQQQQEELATSERSTKRQKTTAALTEHLSLTHAEGATVTQSGSDTLSPDAESGLPTERAGEQDGATEGGDMRGQMAALEQLVREQAQQLKQLRASSAHSPLSSDQLSSHSSSSSASEQQNSRFAKKEPRAQDLREYDGASGTKLDGWLKELARCVDLFELSPRETVKFGASRLQDAALDWWQTLATSDKMAIRSFDTLAAALRARFQPVTTARVAREQLARLQQGGRGVNEYIADFQRLATQVGWASLGEENALFSFEAGLRRDIALELRKQGVTTLKDAIALAARIGGLMQHNAPASAPHSRPAAANQMEADGVDGAASLDDRIAKAVLNAMQAAQNGGAGLGAKTQTQRGYQQQDSHRAGGGRGGGRGATRSSGRGGGRGGARPPPIVPGVPAHLVQQRWDAHQCLRCGQEGHTSHACPNTISSASSVQGN